MTISGLYLASKSPRRKNILNQLMVDFEVLEIDVDEDEMQDEGPQEYLDRIVKSKVTAAGNKILQENLTLKPFLVADTVVSYKNKIFGKPTTKDHAHRMLKELSGTTHTVTTGIALGHISESKEIEFTQNHSHTVVEMKSLSAKEIERYVLTEEPMDKAGGYGIQGLGASFVKGIGGCYFNVVGLPIQETCLLLDDLNISYWSNKD